MNQSLETPLLTTHISRDLPELLFEGMETIMAASPAMMFLKDVNLRFIAATPSFAAMAGKASTAELLGHTALEVFEDQDLARRYTADDERVLSTGQDLLDFIEPIRGEDGEARYASTSKYVVRDRSGAPIGILGVCKDVTKQIRARQQYEQVLEYLFSLPDETFAAISIDVTDWRVMAQRKQEGIHMPTFLSMEELRSALLASIEDPESEAYQTYQQLSPEFFNSILAQGKNEFSVEHPNRLPDGSVLWVRDEWRFLVDPENSHLTVMLLVQDIHAQKQAELELVQAAQTDELTGLFNRAATKENIRSYLAGEGANGNHALFIVELDNFKQVNDTFGRQAGDLLLYEVAANLKDCFRDIDIVGRMAGAEFLVLAKNIPSLKTARGRSKMLLDVLRGVYASHTTAMGSISIGVSMYPTDGSTMEELYKKADEALHKAKDLGQNKVAFTTEVTPDWNVIALDKRYEAYNSQVVDHSSSVCYISDLETYDLLHMTKAAMILYGLTSPDQYRDKKCYQVIMGLDKPCPFCTNSQLTEGMEYRWEWYNDNIRKWFDRTSSIIRLDGRPCHLEIGRDITARKEEVDLLTGQLTMEDVLFRCLHTLTNEKDMNAAFHLFLEAIGGFYQASRAYIFEFDLENHLYSNTFEWCAPGVSAEIERLQQLPMDSVERWISKFKTDGEFSISSLGSEVDRDSEEYRILSMQGIRSLMAAPLWDDGKIVGLVGVDDPIQNQGSLTLLRSISEFVQSELEKRRLMEDLAAALEKASIANQSKSTFLFNMSHDIRTPMNAILGFSMMAEKHIDEKDRVLDCLSKLNSAGKHLLRLINDVLDMSRIESGKMAFDLQPHHIPSVLKDLWEMFNPEMQKKDITFTVSCEVEDEFVLMDRLRIDQVELNLISNALKYTPEGGRVDYTLRQLGKTEDGLATYQAIVKDTGIGMSEEFAARVFEAFEREKTSTVDGIQGTGLGMAITKSLIDQMGGSITCKSQKGVGTEFVATVTLRTVTEDALPKKADEIAPKSSFTEKRILLVEDNELNREIAVEILEEFGFCVEAAEDGDVAVELVKQSPPGHYDLILMDIQMPRMDGYTATQQIRALEDKALSGIPIVAMTANAFAEDRQNAMAAGMNEHIAKPIDVPKLIEILQRIL